MLGKLGTLGHGIIRHKGDSIIGQFAETMRREIEGTAPAPSPLS